MILKSLSNLILFLKLPEMLFTVTRCNDNLNHVEKGVKKLFELHPSTLLFKKRFSSDFSLSFNEAAFSCVKKTNI